MNNPKISVIMSVHNGGEYLKEAIQSVLNQTCADFEFIIINDGSTDNSLSIINSFQDQRIKLISRENKGLVQSLNEGMKLATGEFIARMDADDISLPERFSRQVEFLKKNPDIYLCGTWAKTIDANDKITGEYTYPPLTHDKIKKYLLLHNSFIHPSVMFKKEVINKVGVYNKKYKHIEDYEFWTRVLKNFKTANLPEFLLKYRINQTGITRSKNLEMRINGLMIRLLVLSRLFLNLPF